MVRGVEVEGAEVSGGCEVSELSGPGSAPPDPVVVGADVVAVVGLVGLVGSPERMSAGDDGVVVTVTVTSGNTTGGASGGTVACGSRLSTLTDSCCHWSTSSCLRCTSSTVATVVVMVCSRCWASSQLPSSINCCTCWSSLEASSTPTSRVTAGPPKNRPRTPYNASPGPEPYTAAPNPPRHSIAAATEPTSAIGKRTRPRPVALSRAATASRGVAMPAIGVRRASSRQPAIRTASSASSRSVA